MEGRGSTDSDVKGKSMGARRMLLESTADEVVGVAGRSFPVDVNKRSTGTWDEGSRIVTKVKRERDV